MPSWLGLADGLLLQRRFLEASDVGNVQLSDGEATDVVEAELADRQVSPVPDTLLPASKIRDYVGPSVLETLLALEAGIWSEPIEAGGGVHLAVTLDREPSIALPLAEIEALVRQDLQRRRGDEALRAYLDDLEARTPILIDESVFAEPEPARAS